MKKSVVMVAPFNTRSGYGDHARSIFYSIMDRDDLEIKCIDVKWGSTPRNHLNPKVPRHKKLLNTFVRQQEIKQQPDVYIDIRIPNEYGNGGKFNIGITAGVETNVVSPEFIAGMNNMNLNIVPSNFTANTFKNCSYDQMKDMPDGSKQKTGQVSLQKPITVLFEGVDTDVYKPLESKDINSDFSKKLDGLIKENFAYLHVGQWTRGKYGEDRKNIPLLIKCFLQAFTNHPAPPALVLKTSGADFSILDREETIKNIKNIKKQFASADRLPSIYLIHGDLTIKQMSHLYNNPKIKCFISCTHGEGFGRPLLEASCCGLPVIASKWSGHLDFLDESDSLLIEGHLKDVPEDQIWKPIIVKPSKWFNPTEADVIRKIRMFHKKHPIFTKKGKRLGKKNHREYSLDKMAIQFNKIIDNVLKQIPSAVSLKLPKLKKVDGKKPQNATIKLPKLKKVT
ncbi:MAG: hypothetical protein CBE47_00695 [Pelagibacteraceae bacterium TMED287]|nr:MAG: hypothetical protein CBE47_00695 [Pelagibacteraceae bacterium TMED287]